MVGTVPRSLADWMFVRCFTGAVLVAGALLSRRTVSAALRVLGQSASFAVYHRVLSTARPDAEPIGCCTCWSPPLSGTGRSSSTIRSSAAGERRSRHLPGGRLASLAFPSPLPTRCVGCLRHRLEASPLQSLCQSDALAVRHAARAHCLGRLRLGAAVPDHPGAFRTLRTKAGPTAQEACQALLQTARWLPGSSPTAASRSSSCCAPSARTWTSSPGCASMPACMNHPAALGTAPASKLPTLTERVADPTTTWQ